MPLTSNAKHKAFMGYRKGLGKASSFVGLRRIELINDTDLEFESFHRFNHYNHFVKISRVYSNHDWHPALDDPYQSGVDAGTQAANYYKEHIAPAVPFTERKQNVDPDIQKWSSGMRV